MLPDVARDGRRVPDVVVIGKLREMLAGEHQHPGKVALRERRGDLVLLAFAPTHIASVVRVLVQCRVAS